MITLFVLLIALVYGLKPISKDEYIDNCEKYIIQTENELSIKIPRSEKIKGALCTYIDPLVRTYNGEEIIKNDKYEIGIKLEDREQIKSFIEDIQNNEKWVLNGSKDLSSIIPYMLDGEDDMYTYILVYNKNLDTYNQVPTKKGIYEYIALTYDVNKSILRIFNYEASSANINIDDILNRQMKK